MTSEKGRTQRKKKTGRRRKKREGSSYGVCDKRKIGGKLKKKQYPPQEGKLGEAHMKFPQKNPIRGGSFSDKWGRVLELLQTKRG